MVAKYRLDNGQKIYFNRKTWVENQRGVFLRVAPVYGSNGLESIYICGSSRLTGQAEGKATIFKVKSSDGSFDTGFNGTGFKQYFDLDDLSRPTLFRDIVSDGNDGFVAVGSTRKSVSDGQADRDVFIVRIEAGGLEAWRQFFNEIDLSQSGYTDLDTANETSFCDDVQTVETNNEEAWSVKLMPDGNVAVLARFDWIELSGGNVPGSPGTEIIDCDGVAPGEDGPDGCWPFDVEQYYDCDLALLKLDVASGNVLYSIDAGRSVAVDNWAVLAQPANSNELYLCASLFLPDGNDETFDEEIWGSVIKVIDNGIEFSKQGRKDARNGGSFEFCPFGICTTSDGGVVLAGNNACNGDDYQLVKFGDGCQDEQLPLPLHISSNTTWNVNKTVWGQVVVDAGYTLTISNGAVIQFANTYETNDWIDLRDGLGQSTRITVEIGGLLVLDNCTLRGLNACGKDWMWEGIEIIGSPNLPSIAANQGRLEMKNNAQIRDAYIPIAVGKLEFDQNGRARINKTHGGGLVYAHHPAGNTATHFLNCREGVQIDPASNLFAFPKSFRFENTHFANTQAFADPIFIDGIGNPTGPIAHIDVRSNDHLYRIDGCTFVNSGTAFLPTERGTGIRAVDSRLNVKNSSFDRLMQGISADFATDLADHVLVENCSFNAIRQSIHLVSGAFHRVTGCSFTNIPGLYENRKAWAIRLDGATNFDIVDNPDFSSTNWDNYGILIDDSNIGTSRIAANVFTGLEYGVQTQRQNAGLRILCNEHSGNRYSWSVNPQSANGSFSGQGECGTGFNQAGNRFLDPDCPGSGLALSHIRSTIEFDYAARNENSFPYEVPSCVSSQVSVVECGDLDLNANLCDGPFAIPTIPELEMAISQQPDLWQKQVLQNMLVPMLVDSGLINEVLEVVDDLSDYQQWLYVSALMNAGEWTAAADELDEMTGTEASMVNFKSLQTILLNLKQQNQTLSDLTGTDEATILAIAEGGSPASHAAQAVMEQKTGTVFQKITEEWTEEAENESVERNSIQRSTSNEIEVQPNPTSGIATITWPVGLDEAGSTLFVTDVTGRLQKEQKLEPHARSIQLDLSDLDRGVYFVTLQSVPFNKLIIRH